MNWKAQRGCAITTTAHLCTNVSVKLSVQMSQSARATRLDTHRVRIGTADGILLNLSASGALVRLPRLLQVAADATLSLYADDRWLDVPCRVVRCTETEVHMDGAAWGRKEFETAVSFADSSVLSGLLSLAGES